MLAYIRKSIFDKWGHGGGKRKNRLTNLRLTSVDLCPQGANPQADIRLRKSLFPEDGREVFRDEEWERTLNQRLWDLQDALTSSFRSIIEESPGHDQRLSLLLESLDGFHEAAARLVEDLCRDAQGTAAPPQEAGAENKGVLKTMKISELNIDVSALTAEEQGQLSALVEKASPAGEQPQGTAPQPEGEDALAKAVAAYTDMAERLEKQARRLEQQELDQVAQKYKALGDESLRETLGVMKAAGETAYTGYLATLDRQLELLEKTDGLLLQEMGRSGHGMTGSAVSKANAAADALLQNDPAMSRQAALVKAFEQDPALAAEYEKEYAEGR